MQTVAIVFVTVIALLAVAGFTASERTSSKFRRR